MSDNSSSRRRRSDQRNVLYREPSTLGIFAAIFVVAVVVATVLALFFLTEVADH